MRYNVHRGMLIHFLGVLLTIGFLLQPWTLPISVLFQDRSRDAIPRFEIESTDVVDREDIQIPKVLHQVFNMWDDGEIPEAWRETQQSCLQFNQDYEYMLWNLTSARDLIAAEYPWFLDTFDGYRFPVQRADAIRYFVLSSYGGVYLDLDTGCTQSLDKLLVYPAFVATAPTLGLTNSILGGVKDHPFFLEAIESLQAYDQNWILPYLTIMNSAGPHFLSLVWTVYLHSFESIDECDRVRLLMSDERQGKEWSMFYSVRGSSWHHWDNLIFIFVHNHVMVVVFGLVALLIAGACCIWWAVYRTYSRIKLRVQRRGWASIRSFDLPLWIERDRREDWLK